MLRNRNRGRCPRFDTFPGAPDGSPSSRVSPTVLIPFYIHRAPSKRSPHPSMRGGARKPGIVTENPQKNTYIGEKTRQKSLKIFNNTVTNLSLTFHSAGWRNDRWGEVMVVVRVRDQRASTSLISISGLSEPCRAKVRFSKYPIFDHT